MGMDLGGGRSCDFQVLRDGCRAGVRHYYQGWSALERPLATRGWRVEPGVGGKSKCAFLPPGGLCFLQPTLREVPSLPTSATLREAHPFSFLHAISSYPSLPLSPAAAEGLHAFAKSRPPPDLPGHPLSLAAHPLLILLSLTLWGEGKSPLCWLPQRGCSGHHRPPVSLPTAPAALNGLRTMTLAWSLNRDSVSPSESPGVNGSPGPGVLTVAKRPRACWVPGRIETAPV